MSDGKQGQKLQILIAFTGSVLCFGLYNLGLAQTQVMPALSPQQLNRINDQPLVAPVAEPANAYGPNRGQMNRREATDPLAITVLGRPLSGPGSDQPIRLQSPDPSGETSILNIPFN